MRDVIPIALAWAVERLAAWFVTTTRALRSVGESAAASMSRRVAATAITRPGRAGITDTRPFAATPKPAFRGGRPMPSASRLKYPSAAGPSIARVVEPPCGSESRVESWPAVSSQDERPRLIRIGPESAVRTWATAGSRSAAVTVGRSSTTGSETGRPRSKPARAWTIAAPAIALSSARPVLAPTIAGRRALRTIAASRCGVPTARVIRVSSTRSACFQTRVGGVTSAPKTRTPIRRRPRKGAKPWPSRSASLTAAGQSASTPRLVARSFQR